MCNDCSPWPVGDHGQEHGTEAVEKLSQLHAVFDFYDTDRDGRIDRKTMRKMCDLIGFGNPTLPTTDDISFNVF